MKTLGNISVVTAIIGAVATIGVGAITAYATSSAKANEQYTELQVTKNTLSLQYIEIKGALDDLKDGQKRQDDKILELTRIFK